MRLIDKSFISRNTLYEVVRTILAPPGYPSTTHRNVAGIKHIRLSLRGGLFGFDHTGILTVKFKSNLVQENILPRVVSSSDARTPRRKVICSA
jgi:hypothetical protein